MNFDFLEKLKNSKRIAVITGAGISSESGIPTFRGKEGYWKNYRPEQLATPGAFAKDPSLVWSWYDMRREVCAKAEPNPAHDVVAKMESYFREFLLITQNVDGLHRRAGNKKILEIHGHIFTARCTNCSWKGEISDIPLKEIPPKCLSCSSLLRPHILWFGESYDAQMLDSIYDFLTHTQVVFVIGTSGGVSTPMSLASYAMSKGAFSIEVNPDRSTITEEVDVYMQGKAGEVLPELWKQLAGA